MYGLFSGVIADIVAPSGKVIITDPSKEQLFGVDELNRNNVEIRNEGADTLVLEDASVDGVWSFGAMHHVFNKTASFKNFFNCLKKMVALLSKMCFLVRIWLVILTIELLSIA